MERIKNIITILILLGLLVPNLSLADQASFSLPPEIQQTNTIFPVYFFLTQEDFPSLVGITPVSTDTLAYFTAPLGVDYDTAKTVMRYVLSQPDPLDSSTWDATTTYDHTDQINGTGPITDGNGGMVQLLDYHPYGTMRVDWQYGNQDEQRKFAGTEFDRVSGLNYMQARYYSGSRGQFLSQDSAVIGVDPTLLSDPQQLNFYSYARNNPLIYRDADGKKVELVSRPVNPSTPIQTAVFFATRPAHSFLRITPENRQTIGNIGVNTNNPFTLGATESNNTLVKEVNGDARYINSCTGCASVVAVPPKGVSQEQFEANIVGNYNSMPATFGNYGALGSGAFLRNPNSNNAATSILTGAGVNAKTVDGYQRQLGGQNYRWSSGLGEPIGQPTILGQLSSAVRQLTSTVAGLGKKIGALSR